MLATYPNRCVVYLSDEQLAAVRGCVEREPYYSLSRMLCRLVAEGLATRNGPGRAREPRAPAPRRRRRGR